MGLERRSILRARMQHAHVRVKMTDHDEVLRAAELMDAHVHVEPGSLPHHQTCMVSQVHGDRAIAVMRVVLPHLDARRTVKVTRIVTAYGSRTARREVRR
jgi:hypothetical protein